MNFTLDWEYEIVDQSGLQSNSWENWYYCPETRTLQKKKSFTERFFFQESRNPVRKRKFSKMEAVTQNLAIKCYHEFYLSSHKDLEILILVAPFLLLIKVIL